MKPLPYLTVIAGPMFSGKTEELIRLVRRAVIGKKSVHVFKPLIDTRYGHDKKLFSHNGMTVDSEVISKAEEILEKIDKNTQLIAIDEAQWLGDELIPIVRQLLSKRISVIIAGLALTFDQKPFSPVPTLMAMADSVTKLSAVCSLCGADAIFHKRITHNSSVDATIADPAFVGTTSEYQARCRNCISKKP
jgi:thymidine kinase